MKIKYKTFVVPMQGSKAFVGTPKSQLWWKSHTEWILYAIYNQMK